MTDPSTGGFESWVTAVATAQPDPPRSFDRWELARALVWSRDTLLLSSLGAGMLAVAAWFISGWDSSPWAAALGAVLFVAGGLFCLLANPVGFYRAARALRRGVRARATIVSVTIVRRLTGPETAVGERIIHHPRGEFRQRFEVAAPWKRQLREGTVLDVLVDPGQRKVLWELGIEGRDRHAPG